MTTVLDGQRLALATRQDHASRAARVTAGRGRPPRLGLVAFHDHRGRPRYVDRKVRACKAVGVEVVPIVLSETVVTGTARAEVERLVAEDVDGIFLEFPFPGQVDVEALIQVVPERLDVDVMTPGRVHRYLTAQEGPPPITVTAGMRLLDGFGVRVEGLDGVVVSESTPFAEMFRAALERRGAHMRPVVAPDDDAVDRILAHSDLAVIAAAQPGRFVASEFAAGAIVIDVGYYNPGGAGDVDTRSGVEHLAAIAPVPGGIGPMTVTMLVERVIEFAARSG